MTKLGNILQTNRIAKLAEILILFVLTIPIIFIGWRFAGGNLFARQIVVWFANLIMIVYVWIGLSVRGQTWDHFGLSLCFKGWLALVRIILMSIVVFVLSALAFMVVSVFIQTSSNADMSGYNHLKGNLPLFLLSLAGVYIVSSFGEEVVYRGFLINRIAELGNRSKPMWFIAIIISSVIFGLAHFQWGIVGIFQTSFMGLALSTAYILTKRNLLVLILAHVYLDTILHLQLYLA